MQPKAPNNTTSFDIIKATAAGYKFLWHRRKFIIKLALLPILVKFICHFISINMDLDDNILRKGLIMFPAYLLEGYLVCALIRFAVYPNEELQKPPGSAGADDYYKRRGDDIKAGAILYSLIQLVITMIFGVLYGFAKMEQEAAAPPEPTFGTFISSVLVFIFCIWAFRLVWLNVPVTLGFSMSAFMRRVKGMSFSFHIFSVWIMCLIPLYLVALLTSDIIVLILQNAMSDPAHVYQYLQAMLLSVLEVVVAIVSNIAIGLGIYWIMTGKNIEQITGKKK